MLAIRPGERRDTWAAFLTLFGLIGSHAILETARDALFLARIPATRLPWVFLAIAIVSLLLARLQSFVSRRPGGRPALAIWTLVGAAITLGFHQLHARMGPAGIYALYVWSGVLTTLVLVHFWTLIGDRFTVTQAKRLFGFIGAGSVIGAIAGSGAAGLLAAALPPRDLLLVSAAGFALTAAVPALFRPATRTATAPVEAGLFDDLGFVTRNSYARRVVAAMVISTACLVVADFLFKSMVAVLVPADELAGFLGTVYFTVNILSLFCQLVLVGAIVRRFSLGAGLAILPGLLAIGGLGVALTGGLAAVVADKAADGALRHSLHRTASELLYLPLGDEARRRMKAFVDVVGLRGGQVAASSGILALIALDASPRVLALVLAGLAGLWVATAIALRGPYVEIFRTRLRTGRVPHLDEFPELDVASLETLIAALDSDRDNEVVAALHVLEREGKARLIPALILYHPSEQVVERALAIFARAGRRNAVHVIDRVVDHPSPRVRAATIAARSVLAPEPRVLLARLDHEPSAEVRATIVVHLIASGEIVGTDATERIAALLRHGAPATKVALAEAIALRGASGFGHVLVSLAEDPEPEVRVAAIAAMGRLRSPELIPPLIAGLASEVTRRAAERALVAQGGAGFDALRRALEGGPIASELRWRIPHAMSQFDPRLAGPALLAWLPAEPEGSVRYQMIRSLERLLRTDPTLPLDRGALDALLDRTLRQSFGYVDRRLILLRGADEVPSRRTPGHELLRKLLEDKEEHAVERLFRLLGLVHPTEDFVQIYRGLCAGADARATSMELIERILVEPLRTPVLALVDDAPDARRLALAGAFHRPLGLDYEGLLADLLASPSEAVQDIATFHVAELGLAGLRHAIEALPNPDGIRADVVVSLARLGVVGGPA